MEEGLYIPLMGLERKNAFTVGGCSFRIGEQAE